MSRGYQQSSRDPVWSPGVVPPYNSDSPLDVRRTNMSTPLAKNWSPESARAPQSMANWPLEKEHIGPINSRDYSTLSAEWNACLREQSTLSMEVAPFRDVDSRTQCTVADMKEIMDSHGADESSILQRDYHGSVGLCKRLYTSPSHGLTTTPDNIRERWSQFGRNVFTVRPLKSYFRLVVEYILSDIPIIIIIVTAVIALGLSFYHKPSQPIVPGAHVSKIDEALLEEEEEPEVEWVEGTFKLVMVIIVILISTLNDWYQDRHFRSLQSRLQAQSRRTTLVIRNGRAAPVPVPQLVVGDVCMLSSGDVIPADGIVISCTNMRVDEQLLTGIESVRKDYRNDPFLLAGTAVASGTGRMVVTAVGANSQAGIIMTLIGARTAIDEQSYCCWGCKKEHSSEHGHGHAENEFDYTYKAIIDHPVEQISIQIMIGGIILGILTSIIWWIRYSVDKFQIQKLPYDSAYTWNYIYYLVRGIQVVLVAVPEGLPIVVAVAMAFQAWRMRSDRIMVRYLKSGEAMGHTTSICTDMTGVITTGRFMVVHNYICEKYYRGIEDLKAIPKLACDLLALAISINTRYNTQVLLPSQTREYVTKQIGDRTECAMLRFLRELGRNYESIRQQFPKEKFVKVYAYNSVRRARSTVVQMPNGAYMLFSMGPSDTLLQKCTYILGDNGQPVLLSSQYQQALRGQVLNLMDSYGLRSISIAYKEFPAGSAIDWNNENEIFRNLVCIGVLGIEDPIRPEIPEAMLKCRRAGINVCMVTGENSATSRSIAYKCGLLPPTDEGLTMTGEEFSQQIMDKSGAPVNQTSLDKIWPRLRVLAKASPQDKCALVRGIRNSSLSHDHGVVACTGRAIDDGVALKKSDIGHSMGVVGTAVVIRISDIVLMDDSFTSLVTSVMWGRNMYASIAKFLQFQLTIIVVGVCTLVFNAIGYIQRAPILEFQFVWVCLVIAVLGAIGMAMEAPTEDLYKRKPYPRHQHLVSPTMLKNFLLHSIYQIFIIYLLYGVGYRILDVDDGREIPSETSEHFSMLFNTYILMTLFHEINCRMLHNELNMFRGLHRNIGLIIILLLLFIAQIIIIQFGAFPFSTKVLTLDQWAWSIFFGLFELVWALVIAFIPLEKLFSCCCPPIVNCCSKVCNSCCQCCGGSDDNSVASDPRHSSNSSGSKSMYSDRSIDPISYNSRMSAKGVNNLPANFQTSNSGFPYVPTNANMQYGARNAYNNQAFVD